MCHTDLTFQGVYFEIVLISTRMFKETWLTCCVSVLRWPTCCNSEVKGWVRLHGIAVQQVAGSTSVLSVREEAQKVVAGRRSYQARAMRTHILYTWRMYSTRETFHYTHARLVTYPCARNSSWNL